MKLGLKRTFQTYLLHAAWILWTVYYSTRNSSEFGQWTLRVIAIIGLFSLTHMIIRRNYFEIRGNTLVINKNFFRRKMVELEKIERIDIEPNPFSSSKIILKDKTVIKYLDSHINGKELKQFMGQFNIPVD